MRILIKNRIQEAADSKVNARRKGSKIQNYGLDKFYPRFLGGLGRLSVAPTSVRARGPSSGNLGGAALMGDAEADDTRTTDQSTMKYNSTTGTFDNTRNRRSRRLKTGVSKLDCRQSRLKQAFQLYPRGWDWDMD